MVELLKLIFSTKGLKFVGFLVVLSTALSLSYWVKYYEEFSLAIFQFTSPTDLFGLCLSKFMYTVDSIFGGGFLLIAILIKIWFNDGKTSTVDNVFLILGFLSFILIPPFVIDSAATNDARIVTGGKKAILFATIDKPTKVSIENDGKVVEGEWVGATSEYIFVFSNSDSSFVIVRRSEVKELKFH